MFIGVIKTFVVLIFFALLKNPMSTKGNRGMSRLAQAFAEGASKNNIVEIVSVAVSGSGNITRIV